MRFNWGRWTTNDRRGASPVIGLIILIAMVIAGIAVVLVTGSAMVDSLESGAEQEKVQMCMDETDHRLATVASTGQEQPMDFDDQTCRPEIGSNGNITVAWYDDPDNIDWNNDGESVELGALEFDTGDQTLAHQGGGVWELSGSGASIERAPPIGFDEDDSLQLQFMRLDPAASGGSFSKALNDHTEAVTQTNKLANFADTPQGNHFAIKVESEYADGWERHFENERDNTGRTGVSVDQSGDEVVMKIEDLGAGSTAPHFTIADHEGPVHPDGSPVTNNLLGQGEKFAVDARLENGGNSPETAEAVLSINESGESASLHELTLESSNQVADSDSIELREDGEWDPQGGDSYPIDPDDIGLTMGEAYEYGIETAPDGDQLAENETFYYLDDEANYTVTDVSNSSSDGEIELEATVRNLGTKAGGTEPVTLEITNGGDTDTWRTGVQLGETEGATVTWTLDETAWAKGTYDVTVTTGHDDDGMDGSFTVSSGGGFEIDEDLGVPDDQRVNGTDGQVITDDAPVTINASISNTRASEATQTVTLEVLDDDGDVVDTGERTVTIDGDGTAQVELTGEKELEAGELYEYNISTDVDDLDDLGSFLVVEEPSAFTIRHVAPVNDPVSPGDSLTVSATIENQDATDQQFVWLEGFDDTVAAVEEVEIGAGETKEVTLEWSAVGVPESGDDTTVTVGTGTDTATTDVEVEPRLEVADVEVLDDPVREGGSATVEAELEAVGGDVEQTVFLDGFHGDRADSADVAVSDGDTKTVRFEYRNVGERTDRVTVRTEDDAEDEVVVVNRDGPDCWTVSYEGDGTASNPYQVRTVDQLQCIDRNTDAHYELVDDIDAHGTAYWNDGAGFDPIGGYGHSNEFAGDFDGNGHAIEGLTIDRPNEDFVGLFAANSQFEGGGDGIGTGSTIRNLRLENVSVHGRQVTGGLIGAAGGTIENVRVSGTVEAEYQEVGGIVGSAHNADLDNRLVSEATVRGGLPSAAVYGANHPWGANNLGIGGIVGATGYNTQVSTAYSQADVEGPFGVGGIVGWTSDYASENEQMYWAEGDITITIDRYYYDAEYYLQRMGRASYETNTGGAIFGRGDDEGDGFDDSVYYNGEHHDQPFGEHIIGDRIDVTDRETDEMQGLGVTESGNLSHLDYEEEGGPWVALPDDYPRFAWELAAEGRFDVEIDAVENVTAGEAAEIDATVTSRYADREESDVTQTISLTDPEGRTVDTQSVTLPSTLETDETESITLVWQTDGNDNGTAEITVRSEDMEDSSSIDIEPAAHEPGKSFGPGLGPGPEGSNTVDNGDYDLERGVADGSGGPTIDPDIDVGVDVVEID